MLTNIESIIMGQIMPYYIVFMMVISLISWIIGCFYTWDLNSYMFAKKKKEYREVGGVDWNFQGIGLLSLSNVGVNFKFLMGDKDFGDKRIRRTKKKAKFFLILGIISFIMIPAMVIIISGLFIIIHYL